MVALDRLKKNKDKLKLRFPSETSEHHEINVRTKLRSHSFCLKDFAISPAPFLSDIRHVVWQFSLSEDENQIYR